ncbi:hatching enzyme 1.2-like [Diretmus argenteus]
MEDKMFIDKLSGPENWATWTFQMEHLLKVKGRWDIVRRKLDKKAVKLRFMGYANNAKGYRVFDEEEKRIIIRRDVIFNESDFDWKQEVKVTCSENQVTMDTDEIRAADEPYIEDDVAYGSEAERNADPCTSHGCMWPKSSDGMVYIPYYISRQYSPREVSIIQHGLLSFHHVSCIRFVRRSNQNDYLNIRPLNGCYSYIGRLFNSQDLSLSRAGCVYHHTVQHELLHALGFHHEQKRSDRDQYIRVLLENVSSGMEHNFDKINTLNQETSYDYGSVMHYHRYAFSKNGQPTMAAIPDPNVHFGTAGEMSHSDIDRLNRLYKC